MTFLIWLFFLFGQAFHIYLKASKAIDTTLPNGINSWRCYWQRRGGQVLARVFVLSMLFGLWTLKPDLVDQLAKIGAEHLQPGMIRSILEKVTFPLNVFTGGICGYLIDSIAEKIPFLSRELPSTNGTNIQQVKED